MMSANNFRGYPLSYDLCGSCQSELCCWQRLIFKKCYLNLYTGVLMFA